jgi:hypothetical protein
MRITAKAQIKKEYYIQNEEYIKLELSKNLSKELLRHKIFIEPPMYEKDDIVTVETYFFALSYSDIDKLRELSLKYPEIKNILKDIIVHV